MTAYEEAQMHQCQNVGCTIKAIGKMLLSNGKTKQYRCLGHWRNGKPPTPTTTGKKT